MTSTAGKQAHLEPGTEAFYKRTLSLLVDSKIPFMLGGAYALSQFMDFERHTRDLDIFVYRKDAERILEVLSGAGFKTEMTFPHWLGKAFSGEDYVDVIFSSGNGIAEVDEEAFKHAKPAQLLGIPVMALPAEEIIWSKAFIMERERYDGADIAHLLRACGDQIDWNRLIARFDKNWRVLFSHLILFGFIYPSHQSQIPDWVLDKMLAKTVSEMAQKPSTDKVCQGTILSRGQYLMDIDKWNYADGRQEPRGRMSAQDIAHWTAAINQK
ncbi:MAG: nucleotidyltransferase family protein [Candidatus Melainabacteria bacterium]|nr:nucleotidyltransferase family protein [Candidatus Melainabacteria bacterium]